MAQSKIKTDAETAFDSVTKLEIPAAVRDMTEKGVAQTKDAYAKFKVAADETHGAFEGVYSAGTKGISTLGLKAIETARHNTNVAFDHALALFGVKTLSDAIEINTAFLRQQSEAMTKQAREFAELAQHVAAEASAPVKAQVEKAMKFQA